jgi:Tfp pilus assembly protein PilF
MDALVLTERLIRTEPNNQLLQRKRAHLHYALNERVRAIFEMRALSEKDPTNDTILNSLGIFYQNAGMLDSALSAFSSSLKFAKNRHDSLETEINIGIVYNYQQRYDKAILYFEALGKQNPSSLQVVANLAQAYAQNGQKEKAVHLMELILSKDPHYDMGYSNLGMVYTEMNKLQEAKAAFEKGIEQTPNDAVLLNNYGYLLGRLKEFPKALLFINKSISIYPANSYAYRNRGLVYLDMKLQREACTDFNASKELGFKTYFGDEIDSLIKTHCK